MIPIEPALVNTSEGIIRSAAARIGGFFCVLDDNDDWISCKKFVFQLW